MAPNARLIGVLGNPSNPTTKPLIEDIKVGARVLGLEILLSDAAAESDFDKAFATLVRQRAEALIVGADPLFTGAATMLIALAERHSLPAIYTIREFAEAGGLMTWGTSLTEQYRLAGVAAGKILNGERPAQMPVLQPTKYELVLNLKTAKALGIDVPAKLLALADEVIE